MKRYSGTEYSWQSEFGNSFFDWKVLVTGATGFIGGHLCDALVALGADLHGLSRTASKQNLVSGCKAWAVDLTDLARVKDTISKIQPRLIYHLAGMVTARQDLNLVMPMLQNNLLCTVHLLLAAVRSGFERMVIAASSEEPMTRAPDGVPNSPYAAAKAAASMYARMFHKIYRLPLVVALPFMVYGPGQEPTKLIPHTILALLRGESPNLSSGERVCDFVYVLDVVRGLLRAGLQAGIDGSTIELGTGEGTKIRDVVEVLVDLSGSISRPAFGAIPDRIGECPQIADKDTSRRLIGWEPLWSLQESLKETVAYYRAEIENTYGKR